MVPSAPDAWSSRVVARTFGQVFIQDRSASGKRDSSGQRQTAQNRLQARNGLRGDRNAAARARHLRASWPSPGNLAVRKSAWWCMQRRSNQSLRKTLRSTGKNTAIFAFLRRTGVRRRTEKAHLTGITCRNPHEKEQRFCAENAAIACAVCREGIYLVVSVHFSHTCSGSDESDLFSPSI
jgi:hypothetical protein